MLCRSPFIKDGAAFGCGQCMPCRVNKRRLWSHRLMLEASQHPFSSFVTLTYSDEFLPDADKHPAGNLKPKHLQDWLKRLRKQMEPTRIRYFGVGEYGDKSARAHYHVALFNYQPCLFGQTRPRVGMASGCCSQCQLLATTWRQGLIYCGELNINSAQYIAGYVTKKLSSASDPRLAGRHPEFARMSLRPGLGAEAVGNIASVVKEFNLVESQGDVPSALRHGKRILPLGRYLRRKLRLASGLEAGPTQATIDEMVSALQPLRDDAFSRSVPLKQAIIEAADEKVVQMIARQKIHRKERKL